MKTYRHSNGRIMARDIRGRFRNFTLSDFGLKANSSYMVCSKCGYGEKEKWVPLLKTGECPKCGNQEGHKEKVIPLSQKAENLMKEIDELEAKIGGEFINPRLFNEYGDKLKDLQYELEKELRFCAEKCFEK